MQKAKAFLFVCAGIFLLALSYHLGATNATAAKPGTFYQCFGLGAHGSYGVKDRFLYRADPAGPAYRYSLPVPGTATPIECGESAGIEAVILDNGEVWLWDGGSWRSGGSFPQ